MKPVVEYTPSRSASISSISDDEQCQPSDYELTYRKGGGSTSTGQLLLK